MSCSSEIVILEALKFLKFMLLNRKLIQLMKVETKKIYVIIVEFLRRICSLQNRKF